MKKFFTDLWQTKETKVALILSITLLVSTFVYCFCTRYQMVGVSQGVAYMYNRITGTSWFCRPDTYKKLEEYKK